MISSLTKSTQSLIIPTQKSLFNCSILTQKVFQNQLSCSFGLFDRFFRSKKKVEEIEKKEEEKKENEMTIEVDPIQEQKEKELQEFIDIEKSQKQIEIEDEARMFAHKINYRDEIIQNMEPLQQIEDQTVHEKPQKQIKSFSDKLNDIKENEDGTITHPRRRKPFSNMKQYYKWKGEILRKKKQDMKAKLTPHQYYVTQGMGYERPFTGEYWWNKDVGIYQCACCSQRLFMSDHKYEAKSGYPTFWNHIVDSLKFQTNHLELPKYTQAYLDPLLRNKTPIRRVTCSNCDAHLGHVFTDGPSPFGKRFQINSASLLFKPKPWFTIPKYPEHIQEKLDREKAKSRKGLKDYQDLLDHEKLLNMKSWRDKLEEKPEKKNVKYDIKGQAKKVKTEKIKIEAQE